MNTEGLLGWQKDDDTFIPFGERINQSTDNKQQTTAEKTENYVCTVTGGLSARADAQLTHSLAKVTTSLALHWIENRK